MNANNAQTEKDIFLEDINNYEIQAAIENMARNDLLVYYSENFKNWLLLNLIPDEDIQLIVDEMNVYDLPIHHEHSGGFYSVSDDQFVMMISEEQELCLDGLPDEQKQWLSEEYMVTGDYCYVYNPTAYYLHIQDVKDWLKEYKA